MLAKKIIRFCAVLVWSGVSSIAFSQSLSFMDALQLINDEGTAEIPDNYTSIAGDAFAHTTVVKVIIPNSVTSIGDGAFRETSHLEEVILPSTITTIPANAFENSNLSNIDLSEVTEIGFFAFRDSNLKSVQLRDGVVIKYQAFANSQLNHLIIPNNTIIEDHAFSQIDELNSVKIMNNVSTQYTQYQSSSGIPEGRIFYGSHKNLKTLIYEDTPHCQLRSDQYNIWYNNRSPFNGNYWIGPCFFEFLDELEILIIENGQFYNSINQSSATTILKGNISGSAVTGDVLVLDGVNLSGPISNSLHSICTDIDSDDDGHQDCYDQFINDPDRWFDYGDESNDVPQSPSNDSDGDGILDMYDTAPSQNYCYEEVSEVGFLLDSDHDNVGNSEDCDDDNDGLFDVYEPFFGTNPLIPDSDFDGTLDGLDAFPLDNTESLDTDSDGIGNNSDTDDDNDGHFDLLDAFPLDANEWMDSDLDGVGNNADTDDDNDGVLDDEDAFPYTASESVDTDGDGVGDNSDAFPNDSSESLDTDLDGIGNNADTDDDNDGIADAEDSDPLNDAIGALESQNLFVMGNPVAVNGYLATISVGYDVSDENNQLTGIGFRVHYDSSIFSFSSVQNNLTDSIVVDGMGPYQDVEDFDNDSTTDSYLVYGWAAISGDWPNVEIPAKLTDIQMFVNWADYEAGSTTSNINFSVVSNNEGYEAKATNYAMTVLPATWDFDGNGSADALTDGLMLLRYTFGIQSLDMTTDAISADATLSPTQIVDNMQRSLSVADIDGNGATDALTDGLLLLRYMFGLNGDALVDSAVSSEATRTSAETIEEYISLYMPNGLTSPVQSEQNFMVGDWKLASLPEKRELNWDGIGEWGSDEFYGMNLTTFEDCVADDIYRFGNSGTFEYIINGSTYIHPDQNPFFSSGSDYCDSPLSPWSEDEVYSYTVDENKGEVKVIGFGAYLVLSHVADGNDEVDTPAEAPDSITYSYTKLSEDQILFELDAYTAHFRFTLERVLGN